MPRNRPSVPHSRPSPSRSGRATLTPVPNHQPPDAGPYRLSKSRFTSGLQCHKKLWWEVHEPNALELQPDKVLQDLFDQGRQVGEAARTRVPGPVAAFLPQVPDEIARQRQMLAGPLPDVPVGLHCFEPRECPFFDRCWSKAPDHIRNLAGVGPKRTAAYLERGITSIA